MTFNYGILLDRAGLANCRHVEHQSNREGQSAPKGYNAPQEMASEIAHIGLHVG